MKNKSLFLIAIALLASCASPAERAKRQEQERAQIDKLDDAQCRSYGAAPGSDGYVSCRLMLQSQRQDNARIQQQQSMQMMQQGLKMLSPPQPAINPTVTCTTMPGSYTTTCR
jgi:hypothetical protein